MRKRFLNVLSDQRGFTFVELIVTMVVALIVILGFVGASSAVQTASTAVFERTIAVQDAHRVIEDMRQTAASGSFPSNVVAAYPNSGAVSGYSNLTSEAVTVTYASTTANPLDVTVTVTYKENSTRDVSSQLRTYMTQRA